MSYKPPYTITSKIPNLTNKISEHITETKILMDEILNQAGKFRSQGEVK